MTFDNYIFDLYGTLIDIHTDEDTDELWEAMADYIKREFGISFAPEKLHELYRETDADERKKLSKKLGVQHPEIRISWVWDRIFSELKECAKSNKTRIPTSALNDGEFDTPSPEIEKLCIFFRETSREWMRPYPGTIETLKYLKNSGKKIFLLSNAQRAFTYKEIEECGLADFFDDIFISSDKLVMKPQSRFLEELITKHALDKSKCVMIGNEINSDIGVAVNCKVSSILLNTSGYDDRKISLETEKLNIPEKELYPTIIRDGDIRKIL
ncbi:MAG: HAD family hydrolase [Butyrivibrio sp.]|nr:HAD family hydrolase [Butyrivibrio sp.]